MAQITTGPSAVVPTGTQSERESGWSEPRLIKFWEAMMGLYGRSWRTEHGDEMPAIWRAELMSMTPDEAALGWKACKASGDAKPPTLPQFVYRVKYAIQANKPIIPEYKPLPAPKNVKAALIEGAKAAARKVADVDVPRLREALDGKHVRAIWPRRTILRGQTHPAGSCSMADVWRLRAQAKTAGRSLWDLDLELMVYNGWSPDDEAEYDEMLPKRLKTPKDKGETPFFDRWQKGRRDGQS